MAQCRSEKRSRALDFTLSDEQLMLRDTVRAFVADKAPMSSVREWMESSDGFDSGLWKAMSALGLAAMHIPERHGGAGFSFRELGVVQEELGRGLTPSPMFSSVVLGATLVMLAGNEEQQSMILPSVAMGDRTLAVAILEPRGEWGAASIASTVRRRDDGLVLAGVKSYVVDGHTADEVIVACRDEDDVLRFVVVPGDAPGVTRGRIPVMDMTRKLASVELDDVVVPADAMLSSGGDAVLERLGDIAAVGLAFEQLGGAEVSMEMAVEYAKTRHQFGRPIGSFQAVKHMCADMLVSVESARSAVYAAGWAVDNDEAELALLAPLARTVASAAYFGVTADSIQVHGGIGFTWEHDAHLYFKRAKASQLLLGSPRAWRERLADRIGI